MVNKWILTKFVRLQTECGLYSNYLFKYRSRERPR